MVAAQPGLALGAIKADTYAMIVAMAVVAATLAPLLLTWAFRGVLFPPVEPSAWRRNGEAVPASIAGRVGGTFDVTLANTLDRRCRAAQTGPKGSF